MGGGDGLALMRQTAHKDASARRQPDPGRADRCSTPAPTRNSTPGGGRRALPRTPAKIQMGKFPSGTKTPKLRVRSPSQTSSQKTAVQRWRKPVESEPGRDRADPSKAGGQRQGPPRSRGARRLPDVPLLFRHRDRPRSRTLASAIPRQLRPTPWLPRLAAMRQVDHHRAKSDCCFAMTNPGTTTLILAPTLRQSLGAAAEGWRRDADRRR